MKIKYLFVLGCLMFIMGGACQKDNISSSINEIDILPTSKLSVEICQGTPVECFAECAQKPTALDKEICYMSILNEQIQEFCEQVGDNILCNDFFVWRVAVNVNDCTQISTELWKNRCLEAFGDTQTIFNQADFDGDGLTNEEEIRLGTDFRNADTDGDGYSDYEEVMSGNDPLTPSRK